MKIEIISSVKDALGRDFSKEKVVVIDVLRATSVMITAFLNGAKDIYPFKDIKDVKNAKEKHKTALLAGERKGIKIDSFDFGNSPLEFKKEKIENKEILMTTSNGTRAIESAISAKKLYIGGYLNISGIVEKLMETDEDIILLCSGTDNEFSLDDALCAGIICKKLMEKEKEIKVNDFTLSLVKLSNLITSVYDTLKGSKHFEYLKKIGYEDDLKYCLSIDLTKIVPEYIDGKIRK
ncbi:2-phosphosulfolactate phosphatase [uncultured Cetobacterium sp.]|uniref:2-phosphosulfolactate phosphatase n=2 Tax=uncultured Cetobacterium sp. TaxID=527638 RepID=UPI00262A1AEF|nr:2-phosphosulfolactate phosphatase [uncultured Cetobacterium sp.]